MRKPISLVEEIALESRGIVVHKPGEPLPDGATELGPFGGISAEDLFAALSAGTIRNKDIPPEDHLFVNDSGGGIFSTIDFGQIFGATGTGKTLLAMAIAISVAAGRDLLHWKCVRPRKVIYFDGELAETTIVERIGMAMTGLSAGERELVDANLTVFNRDTAFNELGIELAPLDSVLGRQQVEFMVDHAKAELCVFDSRFCLLDADMKEEGSMPKPLVMSLRRRRVADLWAHHSGKDTTRGGYGDKSAEFLMDFNIELAATDIDGELSLSWHKKRKRNDINGDLYADLTIKYVEGDWHKQGSAPDNRTRKGERTVTNEALVMRAMTELNITKQDATGKSGIHPIARERVREWLINHGYFEGDSGVMAKPDRLAVNKAVRNLINGARLKGDSDHLTLMHEDE